MIDQLTKHIPEIGTQTRYWFVRTEGGSLFQAFIGSGSIATGYSKITLSDIDDLGQENIGEKTKALVKAKYPEKKSPGFAASQILCIARHIQKGDYVLIPSSGTERIAIGQVTDSKPFEETLKSGDQEFPDFCMRRRVSWIAQYPRLEIHPQVWRILQTHQAIVNATEFAPWIDPLIFDLYKKGDEYYFSARIQKQNHINGQTLFRACLGLFDATDDFAEQEGIDSDSSKVDVKINLNSPGRIQFIAKQASTIGIIALLIVLLNGGALVIKSETLKINVDLNSPGIVKAVSDYLNASEKRKMMSALTDKINALQISDSQQIEALIDSINKAESEK